MCGLAGIHVKERYKGELPLSDMLDHLLVGIQERGRHATGFVSVHFGGKGVTLSKKDVPASEFIAARAHPNMEHVQTILGHTRLATQGKPEDNENNHPVVFGTCFATHNGHIGNDKDVVEDFDLVQQRPAEVDSIAIPIALSKCGMDSIANIQEGLGKLSGSMACAVIDPIKHPGQLILAKGSTSPLFVLHHRTGFYWASTKAAIEFMWGALIGTPPNKPALNPNQLGWYEFKYGEAWLIDGDEAAPFKFVPATRKYTSYTTGDSWSAQGGSSRRSGFQSGGISGLRSFTRYTCQPNGRSCKTPCETGCLSGQCTCREAVWNYQGIEYRFDPTELIRARETHGCAVPSTTEGVDCRTPNYCSNRSKCDCAKYGLRRSTPSTSQRAGNSGTSSDGDGDDTGTGTNGADEVQEAANEALKQGHVRCDFCWDWYDVGELVDVQYGATPFLLCHECAIEEGHLVVAQSTAEGSKNEADEVLDHYQTVAEAANAAHKKARDKAAKECKCRPEFVDWILFQATIDELNDEENGETLRRMRKVVEESYTAFYDEAVT